MAGGKHTRSDANNANGTKRLRKMGKRGEDSASDLLTPGNESKQNGKHSKKLNTTVARVVEEDDYFEIETQDQITELCSENEMDAAEEVYEESD